MFHLRRNRCNKNNLEGRSSHLYIDVLRSSVDEKSEENIVSLPTWTNHQVLTLMTTCPPSLSKTGMQTVYHYVNQFIPHISAQYHHSSLLLLPKNCAILHNAYSLYRNKIHQQYDSARHNAALYHHSLSIIPIDRLNNLYQY